MAAAAGCSLHSQWLLVACLVQIGKSRAVIALSISLIMPMYRGVVFEVDSSSCCWKRLHPAAPSLFSVSCLNSAPPLTFNAFLSLPWNSLTSPVWPPGQCCLLSSSPDFSFVPPQPVFHSSDHISFSPSLVFLSVFFCFFLINCTISFLQQWPII